MSSNLQSIHDALKEYAEKTGIDLPSNPFAHRLETCDSVEAIVGLLEGQMKEFKEYREGNRRLINWVLPVVEVVHSLSDVIGEVVSLVSRPGSPSAPFDLFLASPVSFSTRKGNICWRQRSSRGLCTPCSYRPDRPDILDHQAAKGVSSSYDALGDLFECIGRFLNRLQIYTAITLTPSMRDIIVRIMVEILSALALARKQIKVGRFSA